MQTYPPTIVLRHRKENLKKCSLRGLETREDFRFYTYPKSILPPLDNYVVLVLDDAPVLSEADASLGLFIIDATWRYAEVMAKQIEPDLKTCLRRALPHHIRTAYPRRQYDCLNPERGLASIEAIYVAYQRLGRYLCGLLDLYHWSSEFLEGLEKTV